MYQLQKNYDTCLFEIIETRILRIFLMLLRCPTDNFQPLLKEQPQFDPKVTWSLATRLDPKGQPST